MAVPVIIVTGFLGCGKTSFLRHLLPVCGEAGLKPALIINEVGDVDVDGELLADLHAEQVKLIGGCVCCTLQSQLTSTIYDVLEREACDLIIIECSGLSNPLDVVNALSAPALLREIAVSHIICLLDAGRADKVLNAVELARTQVSTSNVLILNKADTISADDMENVKALISDLSAHAVTHWTSYGDIGSDNLQGILTSKASSHCGCGCCHGHGEHTHDHNHSHSLPASFCTVAVNLPEIIGQSALESLMESLPENVIRAKGFANVENIGWQVLHKVYDSANITPLNSGAPSVGAVLICIGQHLSVDEINALLKAHCSY